MRRLLPWLAVALLGPLAGSPPAAAAPEEGAHLGVLAGVVLDEQGGPVAGATVECFPPPPLPPQHRGWTLEPRLERRPLDEIPPPPPAHRRAVTGAGGEYRIEGLEVGRRVALRARDTRRASGALGRWPGAGFDGDVLVLRPAHGVRVRVVDAAGAALAARVDALAPLEDAMHGEGRLVVASAATDAQGRATLEGLPAGRWALAALVPGRGLLRGHACDAPSENETLLRFGDPAGASAGGVVTDAAGRPLPGAWVTTGAHAARVNEEDPLQQVWTRTDAQGTWSVSGLAGRRFLGVCAAKPGWRAAEDVEAGARLAPGAQVQVPLVLGPAARVSGRVFAADGAPVAGVRVSLGEHRTLSAADGTWTVDGLGADLLEFSLGEPGGLAYWTEAPGRWLEARPGSTLVGADLRLEPLREIRGRVLDEQGRPVAGAWVSLTERAWTTPYALAAARSGPDGRYSLRASRDRGELELAAETAERASDPLSGKVQEHPSPAEVDLVVRPLGRITVRLEDAAGRPAAGVEVALQGAEGRVARADALGRARFERLRAGPHTLTPSYRQRRHKEKPSVTRALAAGEHADDVVLRLDPPRGLAGTVVDEDGAAAPGVLVRLKADEPYHFSDRWGTEENWWNWWTATDGRGRFEFENLGPGDYWIEPDPLDESALVEAGRRDLRLVWYRDALPEPDPPTVDRVNRWSAEGAIERIEGIVLDPEGRPVFEAQVGYATSKGPSSVSSGVKASQGRFVLHVDADVEHLTIEVSDARDASGAYLALERARLEQVAVRSGRIEVRLTRMSEAPSARAIAGRVLDGEGRPVPFVAVQAGRVSEGSFRGRFEAAGVGATDAEGRFRLFPLGPGAWTLRCAPGEPWLPASASATTGGADVTLTLALARWVEGRVLSPDRRPVPGVRVEGARVAGARDADGLDEVTAFDGSFRLGPCDGPLGLSVPPFAAPGEAPGTRYVLPDLVHVEAGAAGAEVLLARRLSIAGAVEPLGDERLGDVELTLEPEPAEAGRAPLRAQQEWHDRTFEFPDVPPGRWRLTAVDEQGRRSLTQVLDAPARDVRVRFATPRAIAGRLAGPDVEGFRLWLTSAATPPSAQCLVAGKDGTFLLETDDATPRVLFASRAGDERYVRRERVVPGEPLGDLELALGESITGQIVGAEVPAGPSTALLTATSATGLLAQGVVEADGTFAVRGLPPGEVWSLTLRLHVAGRLLRGRTDGVTGGTAGMRLEAR